MTEESTTHLESAQKPSITLQDIASVVEILRVCTERGVWRIGELSTVGSLYERLVSFLDGAGVKVGDATKPNE